MQVIRSIQELRQWRKSVGQVAFVPTMGNLHQGHLSLVRMAKKKADFVVVSIFVNRLQFGQGEDYSRYPRTLEEDLEQLRHESVNIVFTPDEKELYPNIIQAYQVDPPALQNDLCGQFRPGHFKGVATVVTKLFNIVEPDIACFGKKDYQQLIIISNMVADLNMDIQIIPVDTGRDPDGLALSSRNAYLTHEERQKAPQLYDQIKHIASAITHDGASSYQDLCNHAAKNLTASGWRVDYVTVRHASTLNKSSSDDTELVIMIAAWLGNTRLIDNIQVQLPHS